MTREPRYTSPREERRIKRCVQFLAEEAARADPQDPRLIFRYTYLFRTVFNTMLRDRRDRV